MLVTFISECEKKALKRTRRVLDAFANRIGNNAWQTPITLEGLEAVKKLLRKTASKNTAVSCHQLKSRVRTELLWVVGKRNKFNNEGIVAVNYTEQDKFIGEIDMSEIYANTKKQPLDQHLFAVGMVAYLLCKEINIKNSDEVFDEKFANAMFVAGCWHDIGKIDPFYSNFIKDRLKKKDIENDKIPEEGQHNNSKDKDYPRHNESSLLFTYLLNGQNFANDRIQEYVEHAIYWHHDRWFRGFTKNHKPEVFELYQVYQKIDHKLNSKFQQVIDTVKTTVTKINALSKGYFGNQSMLLDECLSDTRNRIDEIETKGKLPDYKKYSLQEYDVTKYQNNINKNAKNNIARTVLVTADWLVSEISAATLNSHIEEKTLHEILPNKTSDNTKLGKNIEKCLETFNKKYPESKRNTQQAAAAKELADQKISIGILNGPAGSGKTKIALEWAVKTDAKKIIWICPRVQICQSLAYDLGNKDSNEYLSETKIEICTGEFKTIYENGKEMKTAEDQEFSGDIVLTTIDQVLNTITTHTKVTKLVQYMDSHVVFDEYHEYIPMKGFNLLFAELLECKKLQNKNNTLLVSATPNFYFVKKLLGLRNIVSIESFNESQYEIQFKPVDKSKEKCNSLYQLQDKNTIVISNTAIAAQLSFIENQDNENGILFHSKFHQAHKKDLFDKVLNSFRQNGNKVYDILRSGPAVQASLNITCDKMISEFTSAENWLQRMGRLDRFGQNPTPNLFISTIARNESTGRWGSWNDSFLDNKLYCLQSARAWFKFLDKKLPEDRISTIGEIYKIYQEFYEDETSIAAIEQDLLKALKDSVCLIDEKITDPINFGNKNRPKDAKVRVKNNSLRGNNRFVQMAVINIGNERERFPNEYAYNETDNDECTDKNLTLEMEIIEGKDFFGENNPNKDLLGDMFKKHYKILTDKTSKPMKQPKSLFVYRKDSRTADKPIYVSYTPEDLDRLSGNDKKPNSYAIYYAIGKNQPIGAISIDKLKEKNDE